MKTTALFTAVCVALAGSLTPHVASAAECTPDDFMVQVKLMSTPEFVKACGNAGTATATNQYAFCADEKCYNYVKSLNDELPTCTVKNVPWRKGWDDALEACKKMFTNEGAGATPGAASSKNETASAVSTGAPAVTKPASNGASTRVTASMALASCALAGALVV
ncbi:hypothetical protein P43SY_005135 [Pythium insidiosum]|uniref:Elicitin-like protein n=1 Tax=Pythium insidiosum TaxID=114742 RepID=A0AAD5LEH3_PYTIN|nr:hypothetical protein P43SY_005135 [Pythium insidiosum]